MALALHEFTTASAAATALVEQITEALQARLQQAPRALLLVSGGRSPLPMFAALAQQSLPWSRIDVSLVDERSVPAEHADANAALIAQHLLIGPAAAARWLPLIDPAHAVDRSDPLALAQRAAGEANASSALASPAVIVLGMGADGHTASLFADSPQWAVARETQARYVALQPGLAPHARVGLSLAALRAQGRCLIWAQGADKGVTLQRLKALVDRGADQQTLQAAGPVALLMAESAVLLDVFHAP